MTVTVQDVVEEYTGNDSTVEFSYPFRVIAEEDLSVYIDGVEQTSGFTVDGLDEPSGGTVTFDTAPATGETVRLQRIVTLDRDIDYIQGGAILSETVDTDFDRVVMMVQDLDRVSFKEDSDGNLDAGSRKITSLSAPTSGSDAATKSYADSTVNQASTYADNAAASASAAATSESNAATSETNAATSETNAATSATNSANSATASASSATAAENAANSLIWNDVIFTSGSGSPATYTVTDSDRGILFSVDTSGGDVTFTLPVISSITMPFTIGIKKSTTDDNIITVQTSGSPADTIDGSSTKNIQAPNAGLTIVADTDPSPDEWTTINTGPVAANMTVETFEDSTDYTSGTTTQLTLSVTPGSVNNMWVYFDGIAQHHSEFSLSSNVITFNEAIPSGTNDVQVHIGTTLSIGVPSDASVDTTQLVDSSVTTAKISDDSVTTAKISGSLLTSGTAQDTSTGATEYDFTGIPSWVKRITVILEQVSTSGSDNILVQIGDSGGIESTSYTSVSSSHGGGDSTSSSGYIVRGGGATSAMTGQMAIQALGQSNTWISTHTFTNSNGPESYGGGGTKALSGALDRVRITTTGGTDTFDAGTVNIIYE